MIGTKFLKNFFVGGLLFFTAQITLRAEMRVETSPSGKSRAYVISGNITKGDYEEFIKLVIKERATAVRLNSRGGDLETALQIGVEVKNLGLSTVVKENDVCASACFFIWANGSMRFAATRDKGTREQNIGLHRPYLSSPMSNELSLDRQRQEQIRIGRVLEGMLIPKRLSDIMMSRPSNEIYWISESDLKEIGEHPPEIEELLINKCDYKRGAWDHESYVRYKLMDTQRADTLQAELFKVEACTGDILGDRLFELRRKFLTQKQDIRKRP
jgi:hypothetical protein